MKDHSPRRGSDPRAIRVRDGTEGRPSGPGTRAEQEVGAVRLPRHERHSGPFRTATTARSPPLHRTRDYGEGHKFDTCVMHEVGDDPQRPFRHDTDMLSHVIHREVMWSTEEKADENTPRDRRKRIDVDGSIFRTPHNDPLKGTTDL